MCTPPPHTVTRQRGFLFDEGRARPFSVGVLTEQSSDLTLLSARRRLHIASFEYLLNISGQTEERKLECDPLEKTEQTTIARHQL
jgi:hypothetical protein